MIRAHDGRRTRSTRHLTGRTRMSCRLVSPGAGPVDAGAGCSIRIVESRKGKALTTRGWSRRVSRRAGMLRMTTSTCFMQNAQTSLSLDRIFLAIFPLAAKPYNAKDPQAARLHNVCSLNVNATITAHRAAAPPRRSTPISFPASIKLDRCSA